MTHASELEHLFRQQIEAYGDRDVERLLRMYTEDCVVQDMADPDNAFHGIEGARVFLEGYFAPLRDIKVDILSVATGNGIVIGELDVRANYIGTPFSIERPQEVRLLYSVADEIRDGKLAYERFYWDSGDFQRQLEE